MITRIQQLRDHFGLTTRAFAIKCGLNQPTLDRMLKGINALNLNCVSSILKSFPDVSAEWLMRGTGPMLLSLVPNQDGERINKLVNTIATLQDTIEQNQTRSLHSQSESSNLKHNSQRNKYEQATKTLGALYSALSSRRARQMMSRNRNTPARGRWFTMNSI